MTSCLSFVCSFIIEQFFQVLYKYGGKKNIVYSMTFLLLGHLKYFCLLKYFLSFFFFPTKNSKIQYKFFFENLFFYSFKFFNWRISIASFIKLSKRLLNFINRRRLNNKEILGTRIFRIYEWFTLIAFAFFPLG